MGGGEELPPDEADGQPTMSPQIAEEPTDQPAYEGEDATRLSVADQGIGISSETAAMALLPFRQVDGRLARKQGGTGLGLSIVNGLIGEHGGRLTIDSPSGEGTRISLDFPAVLEQDRAAQERTSRAPELAAN